MAHEPAYYINPTRADYQSHPLIDSQAKQSLYPVGVMRRLDITPRIIPLDFSAHPIVMSKIIYTFVKRIHRSFNVQENKQMSV